MSDSGTELTSHAMLRWEQGCGVARQTAARSKPPQNMFAESVSEWLRDELPSPRLLDSLRATRSIIDARIAAAIDVFLATHDTARNRGR